MTSIICPKCKGHISEWDVICLACGHSVSPEERKILVKEQEELQAREHADKMAAHAHPHKPAHPLQMKLDRLSVVLLHTNIDVVSVFIISIFLLVVAVVLMLL